MYGGKFFFMAPFFTVLYWGSIGFIVVQLERGLHGIEPIIVANFPTKKYSDAFFSSEETAQ